MVICNIFSDVFDTSKILQGYRGHDFINFAKTKHDLVVGVPTLVYGYKFAKQEYPHFNDSTKVVGKNIFWSYNEYEFRNKVSASVFIDKCLDDFFKHEEHGIDVVFQNYDLDAFVKSLRGFYPLIHNGKYEIYFAVVNSKLPEIAVWSIKKDTLAYVDIDPMNLLHEAIGVLEGECVVFSTDEVELTKLKKHPVYLNNLRQAFHGDVITFETIFSKFAKFRTLSKGDILTYVLKSEQYSLDLLEDFSLDF